jgi:hypothetical protein
VSFILRDLHVELAVVGDLVVVERLVH